MRGNNFIKHTCKYCDGKGEYSVYYKFQKIREFLGLPIREFHPCTVCQGWGIWYVNPETNDRYTMYVYGRYVCNPEIYPSMPCPSTNPKDWMYR